MKRPVCPKCGENRLRIDDYGLSCLCGWSPTVEACLVCRCPDGTCTGHFHGKTETKNREVRPCEFCLVVAVS